MSTIPTNRESDRFMLRLPDGMRDRIKAAAEANNRSMNAEIVAALEKEYPEPLAELTIEGMISYLQSASSIDERRKRAAELNERISRGEGPLRAIIDVASNGGVSFNVVG